MQICKNAKQQKLIYTLLIMLLAVFSITSQSLWGDEICRVENAVFGNYPGTLAFSLGCGQPGYMSIMYLWIRMLGGDIGEAAMRASNLIFMLPAIFYAFRIIGKKGWPLWTSLLFFFHPMFVYYMDEATPYILIYGLSLAFLYHVFFADDFSSRRNVITINAIYLLGVFIHFIFGFAIILYFVHCLYTIRRDKALIKRHAGIMAAFCVAYVPLLVVLLLTLDGTSTGFSLRNLLYVAYSFLGMAGMSLSRTDMRAGNFENLQPVHAVVLALFCLAVIALLVLAVVRKSRFLAKNRELIIASGAFLGVMVCAAIVMRFGVWERHCMPIFPVYMILLIDLILDLHSLKAGKAVLALFFALLIFSEANLRLNYYYVSDDRKGVYGEIAEMLAAEDDVSVIVECRYLLYNAQDLPCGPNQEIIDTYPMRHMDVLNTFNDKVAKGENVVLVLCEKEYIHEAYTYFDNDPGYTINTDYNSFKIVRPVY